MEHFKKENMLLDFEQPVTELELKIKDLEARKAQGGQVSKEFASSGIVVQASWLGPVWQDLTGRQLGVSQEFVVAVHWAVR